MTPSLPRSPREIRTDVLCHVASIALGLWGLYELGRESATGATAATGSGDSSRREPVESCADGEK